MAIQSVSRQSLVLVVRLLTVYSAVPDLSNPTRPRWERPLDTIRSFEAAIDAEYKARQTLFRPGTISLHYVEESDSGSQSIHRHRYGHK